MSAIRKIITSMGGITGLAKKMNWPVSTVQYWWEAERIPDPRKERIIHTAAQEGISLTPNDFFDLPTEGNG